MSRITYKQKPVVPLKELGDKDYGILEIFKIHDLTVPEYEFRKDLFEEHGIKDEFETLLALSDEIIKLETAAKAEDEKKGDGKLDTDELIALVSIIDSSDEALTPEDELALIKSEHKNLKAKILEHKTRKKYFTEEYETILALMNDDSELTSRYLRNIMDFTNGKEELEKLRMQILATLVLKFRYFTPENQARLEKKHEKAQNSLPEEQKTDFVQVTEWTLEDTIEEIENGSLHYRMLVCLSEFAENERTHWQQENANSALTQAELKKRLAQLETSKNKK